MEGGWFLAATAGTAAGAVARAVNWGATPLGRPSTWPLALRAATELCFSTRFPVLVTWGPELVMIYNDGYRQMLGSQKHPFAMGRPTQEVWAEVWADVGPLFRQVLSTGLPTWQSDQMLLMTRSGFVEETYFTYSYSALRDETGEVRGVLDIATETTEAVVDRRRLTCLGELSARLQTAVWDVGDVGRVTIDVLGSSDDVNSADVHLQVGRELLLLATSQPRRDRQLVGRDVLVEVARTGRSRLVGRTLVAALVGAAEVEPAGVVVLEASPLRPIDVGYRGFLRLVSDSVGSAMGAAVRHAREVGELRHVSETLQSSMLPGALGETGVPGTVTRYLPAVGSLTVGGDWYDVLPLHGGRLAVMVGDIVGHDLAAATVMGQLRSACRALLLDRHGPAATLEGLDRFAASLEGAECATVFCAVVDPAAGTLTYSCAGHPPPVVLDAEGASGWLSDATGLPLAVLPDRPRHEETVPVAVGDTVVLYTDGLVERRGESLDVGLNRLREAVTDLGPRVPLDALADGLLDRMLEDGPGDDVALLALRRT